MIQSDIRINKINKIWWMKYIFIYYMKVFKMLKEIYVFVNFMTIIIFYSQFTIYILPSKLFPLSSRLILTKSHDMTMLYIYKSKLYS